MKVRLLAVGLAAALSLGLLALPAAAEELPLLNPACGTKISQSFRLSGDRTCTEDAWQIDAKNITIDLNGHVLRGDRGANDVGILLEEAITLNPADGARIRNGTIRGFGYGVSIGSTIKDSVVENVALVDNSISGVDVGGKLAKIRDNTVVANDEDGIVVQGEAKDVVVSRNRIANNARYGVFVIVDEHTVTKNTIASNGESGIRVSGDRNNVSRNTISGNGHTTNAPGLIVLGNRNEIARNVLVGNSDDAYRDSGTKNVASKNVAYGNGFLDGSSNGAGTGIDVSAATQPSGSGNRSLGNDSSTQCTKASMCAKPKGDPDLPKVTPSCGELVTKSFRLGSDMNCTAHGLVIGAPGITIDLAGHTIRGDGGAGDRGINNDTGVVGSGHDDVTIRNGVVRRFDIGVRINDVEGNVMTGLIAVDNNAGAGFTLHGSGHVLRKNVSVANGLGGFSVFSQTTTIDRLHASNNDTSGIFLAGLAGSTTIEASIAAGNRGTGISVHGDNSTVEKSISAGNGISASYGGIETQALGLDVLSSTAFGNGGAGYAEFGGGSITNGNRFDANGYVDGVANDVGLGLDINGAFYEGTDNLARGNDDPAECDPDLCD